jgi:CheY-like chemotaxis protein
MSGTSGKHGAKVLVVDDNPADQHLTTIYLGEAWPSTDGTHVDYAGDGREAIVKLRDAAYSLLILDWYLPDGNNGHVLEHVRSVGVPLPVVVVSVAERWHVAADLDGLRAEFLSKAQMNGRTLHQAIHCAHSRIGLTTARLPVTRFTAPA